MATEMVTPLFQPNQDAMMEMVNHLFGDVPAAYGDGLVELAWRDAKTGNLSHGRLYTLDNLEDLVAEAARLNATRGVNVYVGAALRHPDTPPFGRANDEDFLALTAYYVDLDDPGVAKTAKNVYGRQKPTFVGKTGGTPDLRAQLWWKLEEPITDPFRSRAVLSGLCAALKGDSTVVNPSRIMRLIGSIAWPVKDGRITERTEIIRLQTPGATEYMAETIERLCVDANWQQNAKTMPDSAQDRAVSSLGFVGNVTDGREAYMRNTILAVLGELCAEHGAAPTTEELFEAAWPQYSQNVDLTREGRGRDEFMRKVRYTLNRFDMGRITSMPTLEAAVASGLAKKAQQSPNMMQTVQAAYDGGQSHKSDGAASNQSQKDDGDVFQLLDATALRNLPPPQWLVDGIIPDKGLTFLYGQRGKGKSFVTLDAALHIASGSKWLGRDTKAGGVIYCAGEGLAGYGVRVEGWARQHPSLDVGNFRLMPLVPNFRDEKEVAKLARTIKQNLGDAKLIIIDTVARAIPGAEENSSKDMGLFVSACDAIRQTCGVAVIGVHHSGKDDERGMRGSSALEGAGDAVIHLKRLEGNLVEIASDKMKDGEEFKPIILSLEKVEWIDERDPLGKPRSTLVPQMMEPDRKMAFPNDVATGAILREIDRAWKAGKPFTMSSRLKELGRYLPSFVARQYKVNDAVVRNFCEDLLAGNMVQICEYKDENYRMKPGLKLADFSDEELEDYDDN
jgi:hypothetical protein